MIVPSGTSMYAKIKVYYINKISLLIWIVPSSFKYFINEKISSLHPGAIEISISPFVELIVLIDAIPS